MKIKKLTPYLILYSKFREWPLILIVSILLVSGCSKSEDRYKLNGKWVCEHHVEYQGELEFDNNTYKLSVSYLFQDSISGSINESGEYSYTSNYRDTDNLFSSGYYYGTITFNSGSKTYRIGYSYGNDESFAFVNYKIDPKITIGSMWWARDNN